MHGKRHILVDRHGGDEAEILEDDAHLAAKERHFAPAQPGDVLAVHHDAALGGQLFAEDELEQSGLAGAGVAHQKDELAVVYMEVDVLQSGSITPFVYLGDMFKIYHEYLAPENLFGTEVPDHYKRNRPASGSSGRFRRPQPERLRRNINIWPGCWTGTS